MELLKLILVFVYIILDEFGGIVRWIKKFLIPLQWYFALVQKIADGIAKGLNSQTPMIRKITPLVTLPFLILPISIVLPAKLMLVKMIATHPIYVIPAFITVKFFGAVFVKETWKIMRPIGRHNSLIAKADDRWQQLENWAKAEIVRYRDIIRSWKITQEIIKRFPRLK